MRSFVVIGGKNLNTEGHGGGTEEHRKPFVLPGGAAGLGRPGVEHSAEHCDLAGVVAVVGDHLPDDGFESAGSICVAGVDRFQLAMKFFGRGFCQRGEFRQLR